MVQWQYSQGLEPDPEITLEFAIALAQSIERGDNVVYMDETSCNMWMR